MIVSENSEDFDFDHLDHDIFTSSLTQKMSSGSPLKLSTNQSRLHTPIGSPLVRSRRNSDALLSPASQPPTFHEEPDSLSSSSEASLGHGSFESWRPLTQINLRQSLKPEQQLSVVTNGEETVHLVTAQQLLEKIIKSDSICTINDRKYKIQGTGKEVYLVVNLTSQNSQIVCADPHSSLAFMNQAEEPVLTQLSLRRNFTQVAPTSPQLDVTKEVSPTAQSGPRSVHQTPVRPYENSSEPPRIEMPPESVASPNIVFGADDDDSFMGQSTLTRKKKKRAIKIKVTLSPPKLAQPNPCPNENDDFSGNVTGKRSMYSALEIDIDAINQIGKDVTAEEKAVERAKTEKDKELVIRSSQNQQLDKTKQFDFKVFDGKTLLQADAPSLRKTATQARMQPKVTSNEMDQLLYQYKKVQDQLRQSESFKKAKLHLGFLFASPFCQISHTQSDRNQYLIFPPLQVAQEVKNIKSAANESNQGIIYKCAVATQTNFVQMLNKCPKMMHISCHGIPNNANTMMENYQQTKNEGDFLLFEHEQLIGELISEKSLRNLITNVWETELVFLAACDSKFAGKIFLKKGVRHVVCIEDRKEVLDKAMITFTNMFYRSVFDGRPICEAFIVAQKLTASIHGEIEAAIFRLLIDMEKEHECMPLQFNDDQKFRNTTDKILVNEIPAKIDHFLFREKEMAKLIQKIMDGQRLVFIVGLLGIGKSWLARSVLHFMKERKYFCGGLIFVQLNGTRTISSLCHQLYSLIIKNIVEEQNGHQKLEGLINSTEATIDFFVDFFNHNTPYCIKKVERYPHIDLFKNPRSNKFLVCLDNAEGLIEAMPSEFKQLLQRLLDSCPDLQVMITSRKNLFKIGDYMDPDNFMFIPEMKGTKPVELFLHKAQRNRKIAVDELADLIMMDRNFDIQSFSKNQIKDLSTKPAQDKLKQLLRQDEKVIDALKRHDLFKQFAGNPLSITKLAACYAQVQQQRTLKTLYQLLLQGKLELQKLDEGSPTTQASKNSNSWSLQSSLGLSIELLAQQSAEAVSLLYFLSLLPSGVNPSQLEHMWGQPVEQHLELIKVYEFLDTGFDEHYIIVTPFIVDYLQQTIQSNDKDTFINKICADYCVLLKNLYGIISIDAPRSSSHNSKPMSDKMPVQSSFVSVDGPNSGSHNSKAISVQLFPYQNLPFNAEEESKDGFSTQQFQECLLQCMNELPVKHASVLQESLNQILNIQHCLEMLRIHEPIQTSDSKSSFKTESGNEENESLQSSDQDVQPTIVEEESKESYQRKSSLKKQNRRKSQFFKKLVKFEETAERLVGRTMMLVCEEVDGNEDVSSPNRSQISGDTEKPSMPSFDLRSYKFGKVVECDDSQAARKRVEKFASQGNELMRTHTNHTNLTFNSKNTLSSKASLNSSSKRFKAQFQNPIKLDIRFVREEMSDSEESDFAITESSPIERQGKLRSSSSNSSSDSNVTGLLKGSDLSLLDAQRISEPVNMSRFNTHYEGKKVTPTFSGKVERQLTKQHTIYASRATKEKIKRIEECNSGGKIYGKKRTLLITPKKSKRSNSIHELPIIENQLTEIERFILYGIAVMYLSDSFQFSLNICNSKFKHKIGGICQANIYRFKALNLEKLAFQTDSRTVVQAVEAVKRAYKEYKAEDIDKEQCYHGMALACFQLGHLYQTYPDQANQHEPSQLGSTLQVTAKKHTQNSETLALKQFKKAAKLFGMINHIKGRILSYQRIIAIDPSKGSAKRLKQLEIKFEDQANDKFTMRKQGADISLMTELVINSSNILMHEGKFQKLASERIVPMHRIHVSSDSSPTNLREDVDLSEQISCSGSSLNVRNMSDSSPDSRQKEPDSFGSGVKRALRI